MKYSLKEILKKAKNNPFPEDVLIKIINKFLNSSKNYQIPNNILSSLNIRIWNYYDSINDKNIDIVYWREQLCCVLISNPSEQYKCNSMFVFANANFAEFVGKIIINIVESEKKLYNIVNYIDERNEDIELEIDLSEFADSNSYNFEV